MEKNTAPFVPYSYLYSDGRVTDQKPVRVVSSCRLDIYTFPFDIQNCTFSFNSYLHTRKTEQIKTHRMGIFEYMSAKVGQYYVSLPVAAIRIDHTSIEEISERSFKAMSTMGEWELVEIKVKIFQFPSSVAGEYQEIRFFVRQYFNTVIMLWFYS